MIEIKSPEEARRQLGEKFGYCQTLNFRRRVDLQGGIINGNVSVDEIVKARQRHQVSTEKGIVEGSFMDDGQKLTLAVETAEGQESRELTDRVNKEMGIAN
jgi:hypothetical protein